VITTTVPPVVGPLAGLRPVTTGAVPPYVYWLAAFSGDEPSVVRDDVDEDDGEENSQHDDHDPGGQLATCTLVPDPATVS